MPDSPFRIFHYCADLDDRTERSGTRSKRELFRAATHPEPRKKPIAVSCVRWYGVILVLACSIAAADSVTFSGTIDGHPQSAEVPILLRGTVNYIALNELVARFGGRTEVQSDRIQVDLSGGQAWFKPNETSVNSALDSFDLRQPVLREGSAILVAVTDVQPLLMKAFGTNATQRVNRASDMPAEAPIETPAEAPVAESPAPTAIPTPRPPRTSIRVAIVDPGHGGADAGFEPPGGAILGASGTKEKDITLAVALKVRDALERQLGIQVRMSRDEDLMLPDKQRVMLANRDSGDILVSLHAGASQAPSAAGFELFHSSYDSGMSAAKIAQSLSDALVESTGTRSRGVREARLSLFREIEMPAVLIEMGFLTNSAEAALLVDDAYQQKLADGIAAGLKPFITAPAATP